MQHNLFIYNTLSRTKESFQPLHPPHVGMYVCGPTVYGEPHLGHARSAITFDLLFRYLLFLEYKVRYVRNITDVGHLENDADEGEDKIAKKARLEELEPMEVVQHYTNSYHAMMDKLNVSKPSIEPHASGHIMEQIEMIQQILDAGFAYESNGSVYFDVEKYSQSHKYGILSGRILEDLIDNTRTLDGQNEKRRNVDFALWKNAQPEHIMRWKSPWGAGFPGWHMECSAMSCKYLGEVFDIHGGGMDLLFPHHEAEIAQSTVCHHKIPAKYWMHNNMITLSGQKMGKSLGNAITLEQFFTGNHPLLEKAYHPMTIRFFMLQAHYRSPLDFSNEALQAAEKGLQRLLKAVELLDKLKSSETSSVNVGEIEKAVFEALDDDLNSPIAIANLFEAVRTINLVQENKETLTEADLQRLKDMMHGVLFDILGLLPATSSAGDNQLVEKLMALIMEIRANARTNKDWATSDLLRDKLAASGISIKDTKDGATWEVGS